SDECQAIFIWRAILINKSLLRFYMKRLLLGLMILFLMTACGGNNASDSPTADLPAQLPPSPEPLSSSPTQIENFTQEVITEEVDPATCISPEPTQDDVDRALSFTGKLFDTQDWERTYTVGVDKVSVTWYSERLTSIAFLEALIFPCGYEELDLDYFFSVDNWVIVFGNYQSYEYVDECRLDSGVRLYQFITVDQGFEYDVHYWVVNDTDTRVISMMVVMPIESQVLIDEFSYSLFPQLPEC
ncbi:MAG TPA: hypothetical protein DIW23_05860, partial [Anaerolineae bacterium]|nr:hypothetical protein [Anaerolineae bacterium]